ncbi:MAG: hypothetical protein IIT37_01855 [Bacteroidales bacterium]|nr:hypothetical protein [Bacteroidales bacterium]
MLRRIAIFTIMLCLAVSAKAQDTDEEESNPVVDSLLREYAAATSDTARLRLCWEIAAEGDNVDTVLRYAQIGVPLCSDGDSSTLAGLYGCQGWAYSYKEKFDSSIECYKKAVQIFRAIDTDVEAGADEKQEHYGAPRDVVDRGDKLAECHVYSSLKNEQR